MALSRMPILTHSHIEETAMATSGQRNNPLWLKSRVGRLTASNFGRVYRASQSNRPYAADDIRKSFWEPNDISSCPPVKWGIDHEKDAIEAYKKQTGYDVKETGLWLFPNGFIGASPDGLVYINGQLSGILEVKCPWRLRYLNNLNTVQDVVKELPFLTWPLGLLRTHDYYHQVQGQLAATKTAWCDFVVWCPNNFIVIVRVDSDPIWERTVFQTIQNYYFSRVLLASDIPLIFYYDPKSQHTLPSLTLDSLFNPSTPLAHKVRVAFLSVIITHLSRNVALISNRTMKWPLSVSKNWSEAFSKICYKCLTDQFLSRFPEYSLITHLLSSAILCNASFQSQIFQSVISNKPDTDLPCTCMSID